MLNVAQVTNEPIYQFLQYGVVGLVVLGFMFGYIWARPAVQRLERDLDKALGDLRRLEDLNREVIIPAITRSSELIARSSELIERMSRQRRDDGPP